MSIGLFLLLVSFQKPTCVGIMGAMDVEVTLLQEDMVVERVDTSASRIFIVGELNGVKCVCVRAGIGKVSAALTAQLLVTEYDIDLLIFTGVAGGIDPELKVGDIVISDRVIHHDYGIITPGGFSAWDTLGYRADTGLVNLAFKVGTGLEFEPTPENLGMKDYRPHIVIGTVVTGDQFIASEEKRQWLEQTFRASCVEMEGAAVAQVCVLYRIPFIVIRSLSDLANEKAEIDFEAFVEYASGNSSRFVKEIFSHLK